jgi:1-phosphatidylinositol-3-phosphate 5-kinase
MPATRDAAAGAPAGAPPPPPARDPALSWDVPAAAADPRATAGQVTFCRAAFAEVGHAHLDALVRRLLEGAGAAEAGAWAPVVARLARRAAAGLSPSAVAAAGGDPRAFFGVEYARGAPEDSAVVAGVALRLTLERRGGGAADAAARPRVVALAGVLEDERPKSRVPAFEALRRPEAGYLRGAVDRVLEARPDVLLVERGVAAAARELLLEAGVAVAAEVGAEALQRVARCTGGRVAASLEALAAEDVGRCDAFAVQAQGDGDGDGDGEAGAEPPLVTFSGCRSGLGATILLCGDGGAALDTVGAAALAAAYAAYWARLEAAFLADQLVAAGAALGGQADVCSAAADVAHRSAEQVAAQRGDGGSVGLSPHVALAGNADALGPNAEELCLSISCRNPSKGVLCEAPHVHAMPFYRGSDLPLARFIASAAPSQQKCPHPDCGEGAMLHLRSFLHGEGQVTLSSVRLPPGKELSGNEDGIVWLWQRPLGQQTAEASPTQRVALSSEAASISFAHVLSLLLSGRHLTLGARSLQRDFAKYLAIGRTVLCLHFARAAPRAVGLPPQVMQSAPATTLAWLREDVEELAEAAGHALDGLHAALIQQLPLLERLAGPANAWTANMTETRETFLEALQGARTLLEGDGDHVIDVVLELGRLRRLLALIESEWGEALAAGDHARSGPPSVAFDEADVAQARHARNVSESTFAAQFVERSSATMPARMAEAWREAPTLSAEPAEGDAVSAPGEAITAGLVARYVSMLEEKNEASVLEAGEPLPTPPKRSPSVTIELVDEGQVATRAFSGRMKELSTRLGQLMLVRRKHAAPSTTEPEAASEPDEGQELEQEQENAPVPDSSEPFDAGIAFPSPKGTPAALDTHFDQWQNLLQHGKDAAVSESLPAESVASMRADIPLAQALPSAFLAQCGRSLLPASDGTFVTVFDDEPTSLISYFLSTGQFKDYLASVAKDDEGAELSGASTAQLDCQMRVEDLSANRAHLQMTAFFAPQFAELRGACIAGGEASYLASMARCRRWDSQGGKSSSYFAKTRDERYIVKQLSRAEMQSFLAFAPEYMRYMTGALASEQRTCLAKVLGVYQVSVQYALGTPPPFGDKDGVMDLVIMENIFCGRDVERIYDLKGSLRDRYAMRAAVDAKDASVLLDEDLLEMNVATPTLVCPRSFARLQRAVWADTAFLAGLDVMDYSLVVGFDRGRKELVVGLIDFIRQYSWDKQVESWVKMSGILGGAGKEPTVVSPRQYCRRFRAAMQQYFTPVPVPGDAGEALDPDELL